MTDTRSTMAIEWNLEEQELLAETLQRASSGQTTREWAGEILVGAAFLAGAGAMVLLSPPHGLAVAPTVLCLLMTVLATFVRFETPFGFTVATQLAFVPLLYTMPVSLVPLGVLLALLAARTLEMAQGKIAPTRVFSAVPNSFFALGP